MPSTPYGQVLTGRGHVNRWVAEGLLARVYLFYTGFYSDKENKSITTLPLMDLGPAAQKIIYEYLRLQ